MAWPIAWASFGLVALGLAFALLALSAGNDVLGPRLHQVFSPLFAVTFSLIGGIVANRRPRNPVGWISAAVGFFYALTLASTAFILLNNSNFRDGPLPGTNLAIWVEQWAWFPPGLLPMTFLLLLFPDGHPPSRRWRPIIWATTISLIAATLFMAVVAGMNPGVRLEMGPNGETNFDIDSNVLNVLTFTVGPLLVIALVGSVAAPIARFRRSQGIERQQLKWMVYAGVVLILGFIAGSAISSVLPGNELATELGIILTSAVQVGIVLAAAIAILKYRLYDIDIVINRTLVYGALTVAVIGMYVITVGALGSLFQASGNLGISLIATGLVAVAFQPIHNRLQLSVNRLMYGDRDDPYHALSRLGNRLETSIAPGDVLSTIVDTVAQTLKLPYVAISLRVGEEEEIAAEYGESVEAPLSVPLTYQMEEIGHLICGPRSPGEPFSDAEKQLLGDMAHQAGVAVHAAQLTADLERSRQRLVAAREEERRRLRRDLHDGLGPELAALNLKLEAARNLIDSDPSAADSLLAGLKSQVQEAIADIRRLVYELRPPALDELGLVPAVRETAATHNVAGGLRVEVEGPDSMPDLPAAVEVAAYRIAQEALHNVTKHAKADSCVVRFMLKDALELEVIDDGVGPPIPVRAGIGLTSMKERASELGGSFVFEPGAGGGSRIYARLPMAGETV